MATELQNAAVTGDWAAPVEWALRRALDAVEAVPERQELRGRLQEALADTADPHSRAFKVASAYDLLVDAQHGRVPKEQRATYLQAGKDVRDAVILCCIHSIGTHSDPVMFDNACSEAFGRLVYTYSHHEQLGPQGSLYAQLHHSYQQLFKHVASRFPSNSWLQGRRRPRRAKAAPEIAPEAEPEESTGESSEPTAAESQTPRSSAQEPPGGASPAAPGAEPPRGEAAPAPRVPVHLEVPEEWRQRVDDLFESIVDRRAKAEVVHGSVERLRCRLKEVERSCYDSAPGQHLCSDLLEALSGVMKRFSQESELHVTCVDVLLSMCVRRGDVFGLQAPDISQDQAVKHLCPYTQASVMEAIGTATQACTSDEAREELTRLLVRTQPVSVVLGAVDEEGTKVLLDEAKHGLSWCFENMEKPEYRKCPHAFFREVMKQCQDRSEFLSMHNWVRGGSFDSRYHMRDRFVVIGLLFGISAQVLTPLSKEDDLHMIIAALKALTFLDSITPFDMKTNAKLVQSVQELGRKEKKDAWVGGGCYELWLECEAECASVLGRLLQGLAKTVADRLDSYVLVDRTIQKACAIVEHATSSAESDTTCQLHAALWCLTQVFKGASSLGDWDEAVGDAGAKAKEYAAGFQSKSAGDSITEAKKLISIRCGEPR